LPGRPNAIRLIVENQLRRNTHSYQSAMEIEALALCLELAKEGAGYTVMPFSAIHDHLLGGEFSAAPVRGLFVTWALHISEAREHATSVRQTRQLLEAVVRERVSSGA
jgi:LysR family transcriptional regulator, nitrogen assimilation regulatory protein